MSTGIQHRPSLPSTSVAPIQRIQSPSIVSVPVKHFTSGSITTPSIVNTIPTHVSDHGSTQSSLSTIPSAGFNKPDQASVIPSTGFARSDQVSTGFARSDQVSTGFARSDQSSVPTNNFARSDQVSTGFARSDQSSTNLPRTSHGLISDQRSNGTAGPGPELRSTAMLGPETRSTTMLSPEPSRDLILYYKNEEEIRYFTDLTNKFPAISSRILPVNISTLKDDVAIKNHNISFTPAIYDTKTSLPHHGQYAINFIKDEIKKYLDAQAISNANNRKLVLEHSSKHPFLQELSQVHTKLDQIEHRINETYIEHTALLIRLLGISNKSQPSGLQPAGKSSNLPREFCLSPGSPTSSPSTISPKSEMITTKSQAKILAPIHRIADRSDSKSPSTIDVDEILKQVKRDVDEDDNKEDKRDNDEWNYYISDPLGQHVSRIRDMRDGRNIMDSRDDSGDMFDNEDGKDDDISYMFDNRDTRDNRTSRDIRDTREIRDTRDNRDTREIRDTRDNREIRDTRDNREIRDTRDNRDIREIRDTRDNRNVRDPRVNRDTKMRDVKVDVRKRESRD